MPYIHWYSHWRGLLSMETDWIFGALFGRAMPLGRPELEEQLTRKMVQ